LVEFALFWAIIPAPHCAARLYFAKARPQFASGTGRTPLCAIINYWVSGLVARPYAMARHRLCSEGVHRSRKSARNRFTNGNLNERQRAMNKSIKRAAGMVILPLLMNWAAFGAEPVSGSSTALDISSQQQQQREGNYATNSVNQGNPGGFSAGVQPRAYNRASGIIGMDVQNPRGEHLGHIKDVVFDFNTQKISYVVMATSSKAMLTDEKLLAVPLDAFTVSADQNHLILNADKSRVEAAAGFSSANWPSVGNTSWGEPFWQPTGSGPYNAAPGQNNLPR
jgi:sporulation protein YlmC with PRC-barrel domain